MAYINTTTNQYPVSEADIRLANPNTSYPQPFPVPDGYAWVAPTPHPAHDPVIQKVQEAIPVLTDKGIWEQRWEVLPKFVAYTDEQGNTHTVAEQEAAAVASNEIDKAAALKNGVINFTQRRLDDFAKARGFDNILSACTYATSSVDKFRNEGQYCVEARDVTWACLLGLLQEIESGARNVPQNFSDIESELPVLTWPTV